MPTTVNFTGKNATPVGNSRRISLNVQRSAGVPMPLPVGTSFKWTLRGANETTPALVKTAGPAYAGGDDGNFSVVDELAGSLDINLHPADTRGMLPGTVKHDLEVTELDGAVHIVMVGDFELSDHAGRLP